MLNVECEMWKVKCDRW